LRAKVRLILEEGDDMRQVAGEALASTRNLPLQLSLLEAAWHDTSHSPPYDLMGELEQTRRLMRGQTQPGWSMVVPLPKDDEATRKTAREAKAEDDADIEALIQSLPRRSGESGATTLYLLYDTMGLTEEQKAEIRPALVDSFPEMDSIEQHMLLETARPPLRDPGLVPALRSMLDQEPTDKDAIARLVELDPAGAKPYVIRAVCDTKFYVPLGAVAKLPDATLPEVDGCLSDLLSKPPAKPQDRNVWIARAELAARFATAAVVPAIREGWKDKLQDGPVLAILLRYEPAEAVATLRAHGTPDFTPFYEIETVFKARGASFPPELRALLREQVKDGSDQAAGRAAYSLSQGGLPEDREPIVTRLKQLWATWAAQPAPDTQTITERKGKETALMSALRGDGRAWYMNNAEAAELTRGCISDECRKFGKPRTPDAPFADQQ
jgi:hypothetical protein